ncbi:serine/threonine-protein phosphatase 6 regulatory ankyrin repeat subunit B-like [Anneissia japonica]|uniref:serine/threonine-protein phosphatase 6 regulatory ankyrin repeat subunit B-like n=1 Tax=Anneissia japonica TaxID=1529436 RepID=UPI001425A8C9|nr:serine/threonine-protein phosphatase 6 regulatory ankyrin repeat subunit B-like [Anneissia japonica]
MHGGLECLVKLLQCDCDTSIRDHSGCMAAHYAAAYNHIECLRFLVKHGAAFSSLDSSGKTLAHSAAQNGAMTSLHWLLEKGAETNDKDGNGNTLGHLAAAGGHAKCFNCYLQHGGSLELTNKRNETVLDIARRFGHPLLMNRAYSNEVVCVHCKDKSELINWEKSHQPTRVQRSMNSTLKTSYKTPLPTRQKSAQLDASKKSWKDQKHKNKDEQNETELPPRDLAARYFIA